MRILRILIATIFVFGSLSANAAIISFDIDWSGAEFNNGATANGRVWIDDAILPNPGNDRAASFAAITDFTITVGGASSGNGTFGLSDFSQVFFLTGGLPLDLTTELVGQATGNNPWGARDGSGGDFNFFSAGGGAPTSPTGVFFFQFVTNNGAGDRLGLTSMRPSAVTEPGTLALFGLGLAGLGFARRRRTA